MWFETEEYKDFVRQFGEDIKIAIPDPVKNIRDTVAILERELEWLEKAKDVKEEE